MKTLSPKYSDGSREMRPFIREPIFLTLKLAPKFTSAFHSRSPTQNEPHSTTAYLRFGYLSNFPENRSCQRIRWVQNGTSEMYMATFSP